MELREISSEELQRAKWGSDHKLLKHLYEVVELLGWVEAVAYFKELLSENNINFKDPFKVAAVDQWFITTGQLPAEEATARKKLYDIFTLSGYPATWHTVKKDGTPII